MRSNERFASLGSAAALILLIQLPVLTAVADEPAYEVARVEAFRSTKIEIKMRRMVGDEKCRAKPHVPASASEALKLRIACGAGAGPGTDWNKIEPAVFIALQPTDPSKKNQLKIVVGGQSYKAKASYFKLGNRAERPLPPCSAFDPDTIAMAGAQGSTAPMCDRTR